MKRIVVITTGGAIGARRGPVVGGATPTLKGEDFLAMLPRQGIDLVFEEFANLPASHFTPVHALDLSHRIELLLANPEFDGAVVIHGPDTLEETAYLLDLTLNLNKPVVLTGAMRSSANPSYDGVINLANAIRLAAAPEAQDLGVLAILGEAFHAATTVQQVHSQTLTGFESPASGPLGWIEGERVVLRQRPFLRQHIACQRIEEMVDLIRVTQGADVRQLRHSIEDGVAGIVIEALGGGRLPPWWLPLITEALHQRTMIVLTSRCAAGGLGDEFGYVGAFHDLRRLGVLFAHHLSGPKARIKLMVALGAARTTSELRSWFVG
ncbi:asparaginase/glutaminase [Oscillochloris trichoides DG-6]|uniref:Asparaginase/glutaminase n=1 Tax=Oscillochloris trichoides DG-6 TaxID=765420 RepID=E1IGX1_9CHLR|nr:asparaginase [Oscillochloris trichoides]EFO79446.1 asparaginase/glutaminase [Oscillochloris trichoides DG-6]